MEGKIGLVDANRSENEVKRSENIELTEEKKNKVNECDKLG